LVPTESFEIFDVPNVVMKIIPFAPANSRVVQCLSHAPGHTTIAELNPPLSIPLRCNGDSDGDSDDRCTAQTAGQRQVSEGGGGGGSWGAYIDFL
jgi:hypothetical protein